MLNSNTQADIIFCPHYYYYNLKHLYKHRSSNVGRLVTRPAEYSLAQQFEKDIAAHSLSLSLSLSLLLTTAVYIKVV